MASPTPGRPVRGSTTGRPLMAALDLFGRRWTLRVVWELKEGSLGFRSLQQRCDNMSSSVLRQRLLELADACLVEQTPEASTPSPPSARTPTGPFALSSAGRTGGPRSWPSAPARAAEQT
ncbi:hypothetical protein Srufu_053220 [Streptomyces libani subsp. rufus]|nr:hypothetical protein Srufu_053220 [Streptomyces libani subsp. rufus]